MTTMELSPEATAMLGVVERNRTGTSFVEIEMALRMAGIDPEGEYGLEHPACGNLVMWVGVSRALVDGLNELLGLRRVHYRPTSFMVYAYDGRMPQLPIAKRPPRDGYREPHWVPVVINYGPTPNGGDRD